MTEPRIFMFDTSEDLLKKLVAKGFNCHSGSLGKKILVNNLSPHDKKYCLNNLDYPLNLHEFDIVVINLQDYGSIPFEKEKNKSNIVTGSTINFYYTKFPETILDPKPRNAYVIGEILDDFRKKNSIVIILSTENYQITYTPISVSKMGERIGTPFTHDINSIYPVNHFMENKSGTKIKITSAIKEFRDLFNKYADEISYDIIFRRPLLHSLGAGESNFNPNFYPLIQNDYDETISYLHITDKLKTIVLPKINNPDAFLFDLLTEVLPEYNPESYPEFNKFSWLNDEYYQTNELKKVLKEKVNFEKEYKKKERQIIEKIEKTKLFNNFIYKIITETGDELVKEVYTYLIWLGFDEEKVRIMDEESNGKLEEDIQVDLDDGLLVVEIKGIIGNSKDEDCSQISKIKYRRAQERKKFDVFALFIVNHQRFIPAKERNNPPFTDDQVGDAINDERGLLSTYELFKLYFWINDGLIEKEDAKKKLMSFGLVNFAPSNARLISEIKEVHYKGFVAIIILNKIKIRKGDELIIEEDGNLNTARIEDIKLNNVGVDSAENGEVGIKLDKKISIKSKLYLRNNI